MNNYKTLTVAEIDELLIDGANPEELRKKYHIDSKKVARAVIRVAKMNNVAPAEESEEVDDSILEHSIDNRQIRHVQYGGKKYIDQTDFYNETGGAGW